MLSLATIALSAALAADHADDPTRLMTFNIRFATAADGPNAWPNRRALVIDRIRASGAQVVGLQEALASQIDELKQELPEYRFVGSGREGGRKGEHVPILVQERHFSIEAEGQFWLSETPRMIGSRGFDAALPRICTYVVLRPRAGGELFAVLNAHFDHRGSKARVESAKLLVSGMPLLDGLPRVVLGDFNAGEQSEPMQVLRAAGLRDSFRVIHPDAEGVGTFNGFRGRRDGEKIDGIYVDGAWKVLEAGIDFHEVDGRAPSDHWPVTASMVLNDPSLDTTDPVARFPLGDSLAPITGTTTLAVQSQGEGAAEAIFTGGALVVASGAGLHWRRQEVDTLREWTVCFDVRLDLVEGSMTLVGNTSDPAGRPLLAVHHGVVATDGALTPIQQGQWQRVALSVRCSEDGQAPVVRLGVEGDVTGGPVPVSRRAEPSRFLLGDGLWIFPGTDTAPARKGGLLVRDLRIFDRALSGQELERLGRAGAHALVAGPMVGAVTDRSVALWAAVSGPADVRLRWRVLPDGTWNEESMGVDPLSHHAARRTLTGLSPSTNHAYEILVDGVVRPQWRGTFKTAPPELATDPIRIAVTSCMKLAADPVQPLWYLLKAKRPDLQLLLGDNAYVDSTDRDTLWHGLLGQRRVPSFAAVLRHVPTYAIWDDHDYGPNNSDGTAPGKEASLQAFRELWANPYAGTPGTPGAFTHFVHGDCEFFLLDGRFHRSPNDAPDDDRKRIIGDGQFEWLVDRLRSSKATFKFIACGSTFHESITDGWRLFSFERTRLLAALAEHQISGVIWLSGDVHYCAVRSHPTEAQIGYRMPEVISSGIGQPLGHFAYFRGQRDANAPEWLGGRPRRGQEFVLLDVHSVDGERVLDVSIHGQGDVTTFQHRFHAHQLRPAPVQEVR